MKASYYDKDIDARVIHNADELLDAIKSDPYWEFVEEDTFVDDDHIHIDLESGLVAAYKLYAEYSSCFFPLNEATGAEIGVLSMAYPFTMKLFSTARDVIEKACCEWIKAYDPD